MLCAVWVLSPVEIRFDSSIRCHSCLNCLRAAALTPGNMFKAIFGSPSDTSSERSEKGVDEAVVSELLSRARAGVPLARALLPLSQALACLLGAIVAAQGKLRDAVLEVIWGTFAPFRLRAPSRLRILKTSAPLPYSSCFLFFVATTQNNVSPT